MWELKNLSNPDYVEAFRDGAGFTILVILIAVLFAGVVVWLARLPIW